MREMQVSFMVDWDRIYRLVRWYYTSCCGLRPSLWISLLFRVGAGCGYLPFARGRKHVQRVWL